MLILLKRWFLQRKGEAFWPNSVRLSVASSRSEKDVVITAPSSVPFFLPRFAVVDTIWVFQDGQISLRVANLWKGPCTWERICWVQYYGSQGAIQCRLVDFAQNWYGYIYNEILTFRTAQHHLDVDSPLNSLEVFVLVILTDWMLRRQRGYRSVILPKQATPWYQFVVLAVWTYLLHGKSISLSVHRFGKTLLWWSFSGRWCRFLEVKWVVRH
jgi:hypothetical protein